MSASVVQKFLQYVVISSYVNPWAVFTSSDWLSPLTSGDNLSAHVP